MGLGKTFQARALPHSLSHSVAISLSLAVSRSRSLDPWQDVPGSLPLLFSLAVSLGHSPALSRCLAVSTLGKTLQTLSLSRSLSLYPSLALSTLGHSRVRHIYTSATLTSVPDTPTRVLDTSTRVLDTPTYASTHDDVGRRSRWCMRHGVALC